MVLEDKDRLAWVEYPDRDFPYYNDQPVDISSRRWLLVMSGVVAGFLVLVLTPQSGQLRPFVAAVLFSAIPLVALSGVAGPAWTALFHRLNDRDLVWAVAFALINIIVSFAVGVVLSKTVGSNSNAIFGDIARLNGVGIGILYLRTGIQLFGEEIFSILPFLALLWYLHSRLGWRRGPAVLVSWAGCALWFGAAHLPTYGWNVIQAFSIIGLARVILLLAYLKTKNLFVSFGAHLLTDWTYFSLPLILSAAPAHSA